MTETLQFLPDAPFRLDGLIEALKFLTVHFKDDESHHESAD
jgi:hypothetical protein